LLDFVEVTDDIVLRNWLAMYDINGTPW